MSDCMHNPPTLICERCLNKTYIPPDMNHDDCNISVIKSGDLRILKDQLQAALKVVEGFRRINFHENTYDAGVYIVEAHEADRATQALAELDALRGSEK